MMTTTLSLVLSMSIAFFTTTIDTPQRIPVDINFCEFADGVSENICDIKETETSSNNKIYMNSNQQDVKLLIDKRNVTSEKTRYIFSKETIKIENRIEINMPYIRSTLLIRPGTYPIERTAQGYCIHLSRPAGDLAAN